jgi:hypothetical protein
VVYFLLAFPPEPCIHSFSPPCMLHALSVSSSLSWSFWLYLWSVHIMKPFIMQLSPTYYCFIHLLFFPKCERLWFSTIQNYRQNVSFVYFSFIFLDRILDWIQETLVTIQFRNFPCLKVTSVFLEFSLLLPLSWIIFGLLQTFPYILTRHVYLVLSVFTSRPTFLLALVSVFFVVLTLTSLGSR